MYDELTIAFTTDRSTVTTEQRAEYTTLIDEILASADLTTVSAKKIRNIMAEKLGYDISDKKVCSPRELALALNSRMANTTYRKP